MTTALSVPFTNHASDSMKRMQLPFAMPPKDATITEKSTVSFGVVITIITIGVGVIVGGASWVWWASNVSARLSSIEGYMATQNSKVVLVDQLDARLKMLETYGAPSSKNAIEQLGKELSDLRRSMELQQARAAGIGGSK